MKKKNLIFVTVFVLILLSVLTMAVNADTKTYNTKISSTNVTLYAENSAYKYDNTYGGCLWISRSSPWVSSYKQIDPAQCRSKCNGGFIISYVNGSRSETSGYVSLSKTVTYRINSCPGYLWPSRVIESEAKHGIYHDYGVWEPWTFASYNINCKWCNPY
ncbi:MAG: hypothetical protein CL609_01085 [Anaerolineaceae bacterium]|nr:hypothetical protein [Anaerolineaceae bacterium]